MLPEDKKYATDSYVDPESGRTTVDVSDLGISMDDLGKKGWASPENVHPQVMSHLLSIGCSANLESSEHSRCTALFNKLINSLTFDEQEGEEGRPAFVKADGTIDWDVMAKDVQMQEQREGLERAMRAADAPPMDV